MTEKAKKSKQTVTLRLDDNLVFKMKESAKSEHRSLNSLVEFWLFQKVFGNNPVLERNGLGGKHPLWKDGDPKENTPAFFMRYNCNNYEELKNKQ